MLSDYGIGHDTLLVYCNNKSTNDILENSIQHSRTKHIEIKHHFIRDLVEEKIIALEYISTENQLADIFTKPLDPTFFVSLQKSLGISPFP